MSDVVDETDLVDRLSRASRLISAWESFELGRGMVPPEAVRYPELAKLLAEAASAIGQLQRQLKRRGEFLGERGPE